MPTSISQFPILISVLCWIKTNLKGFKTNYCLLNSLQGISYPPKQHRFVEVEIEVFSFYIFDKLLRSCLVQHMHPLYFLSPLTFPIVEVNLTIYMFLESIGSSVCIQYQQRYIFLSSTSSSFLLSNNKMNYTINSK